MLALDPSRLGMDGLLRGITSLEVGKLSQHCTAKGLNDSLKSLL